MFGSTLASTTSGRRARAAGIEVAALERLLRRHGDRTERLLELMAGDPGLAARFADEALLLFGDGRWSHGPAAEILDPESVAALYGVAVRELRWEDGRTFVPG